MNNPTETFLDALRQHDCEPRPAGNGWEARCPAHNDKSPSLSVSTGNDGRVLASCHAGCTINAVCDAISLQVTDLFPRGSDLPTKTASNGRSKAPKVHATIERATAACTWSVQQRDPDAQYVASWPYHDVDGNVVLVAVKYRTSDSKEFRQISHVKGGWRCRGIEEGRPLYGLPVLLEHADEAVCVCEGEKDADALHEFGFVATTSSGGAEAASRSDWSIMSGRTTYLFHDNDSSGERYAADVAAILSNHGAKVYGVRLPVEGKGEDVFDFIQQRRADGVDDDSIRAELDTLIADAELETVVKNSSQPIADPDMTFSDAVDADGPVEADGKDKDRQPAQSEQLVQLALQRYRLGRTSEGEAFAVAANGPNIALMLRGSRDSLRAMLAREYRREHGRTPSASSLADAMVVLAGEAEDAAPEPVHIRVAQHREAIVIDIGDESGKAIIVTPKGWETVSRSPVLFRRTALTSALPEPEHDGSLDDLRDLVNVTDDSWPVMLGWVVAAIIPNIPHPIALTQAEQGSGKSTTSRLLMGLIDPSPAPLRAEPRDSEQWSMTLSGSWGVVIDNVSKITPWWSDALCRACTGDGWVRRKLYSDSDLSVLSFRRVVMLTAIDTGAMRGDLGDRLVIADLNPISETDRKAESTIDGRYEQLRPQLLGAVLTLLADVLRVLPDTKLESGPRMMDFARILAAVDDVIGSDGLTQYMGQRDRIASDVVEGDCVAPLLVQLSEMGTAWEGTAAELRQTLFGLLPDGESVPRSFPKNPRAMAAHLRRLRPTLKQIGIAIEHVGRRGHDSSRTWLIEKVGKEPTASTAPTAEAEKPASESVRADSDAVGIADGRALCDRIDRNRPHDRPHLNPDDATTCTDAVYAVHGKPTISGRSDLPPFVSIRPQAGRLVRDLHRDGHGIAARRAAAVWHTHVPNDQPMTPAEQAAAEQTAIGELMSIAASVSLNGFAHHEKVTT